ncbi:MAG: YIP1 family protein [Anaerolineae bacterium]
MLTQIIQRLSRLTRRDFTVFLEIRNDQKANAEAALIVVAVSIIAALSAAFHSSNFFGTLAVRFVAGVLLNWGLWSYTTVFVLTNFFGIDAEFWQMARLIGYANLPMALAILAIFGCLGTLVASLAWVIALVMAFFIVREAYELSTERAIIATVIGWLAVFLVSIPLNLLLGVR